MGLQLLIGGAGSGKSTFLMDEIIEMSIAKPEKRFFYLVPEQYTAQIEEELIRRHKRHGLLNIEVLSLTRLAYRIFNECGKPGGVVLDDNGKNMILAKIARENEKDIPLFGNKLRKPGYISEMKSVISELTQYRVTSDEIISFCEEDNSFLSKKLKDLAHIYTSFESAMAGRFYQAEELLMHLVPMIKSSKILKGSVIVFDGYTGFTPTQKPLIEELFKVAEKIYAAVTIDKEHLGGKEEEDVFSLSKGMIFDLTNACILAKKNVNKYIYFDDDKRHSKSLDLKFLTENFLNRNHLSYKGETKGIQIIKATNPDFECQAVAEKIRWLVRWNDYKYEDIAVIMGDESSLIHPLSRAFKLYDIPGFFDEKISILKNPACEVIRSILNMADRGYDRESIMRFLRCGLISIKDVDIFSVDEFENYILAHGIRSFSNYEKPFEKMTKRESEMLLDRVNIVREEFYEKIKEVRSVFSKKKKTAKEMTLAIIGFLERENIREKLEEISEELKNNNEEIKAMEYEQIYEEIEKILENFILLLGDSFMTTGEYKELLEASFSEAKIGVIPLKKDMVLAGDLIRTRLSNIKVVFIVGADNKALPGEVRKNGILSEREREKLKRYGISLAPSAREKAYIQQFYLYQQLSKAEEKLFVSYSILGSDGKNKRESSLISGLKKMFPMIEEIVPENLPLEKRELVPETAMTEYVKAVQKAKSLEIEID